MGKLKTRAGWALWILFCMGIGTGWFFFVREIKSNNHCDCTITINYGGHNMSIEDALERAGEGLTVDQADEVQILIEEYCK